MSEESSERIGSRANFWWLYGMLGATFGSFAIVRLAQYGLETGSFSVPLQAIIDAYDDGVRLLLGWAEPDLRAMFSEVGRLFGWTLEFHPHWKHIFVLSMVYWSAFARTFVNEGAGWVALRMGSIGLGSSLVAACAAGVIPLQTGNFLLESLIAAIPVFALHLGYGLSYLVPRYGARWIVPNIVSGIEYSLAGVGFTGLFFYTPIGAGVRSAGLAAAGMTYILLAINFVASAVARGESSGLGLTMLGCFFGGALFFAIDAGIRVAAP